MSKFRTKIAKMFILGFKEMQDPYYQGFAAQVAFYLFLSITPIVIIITQILGLFKINMDMALDLIEDYTGEQVSSMVAGLLTFESAGFTNVIFAAIALWAGSRASFALMRITNYTLSEGTSTGRNYFIERIRAIRIMFLTVVSVVFAIVILVYGQLILDGILSVLGVDKSQVDSHIWMSLRWVVGGVLYFLMVSYSYWILPSVRVTYRSTIPGSVFASVGLLVVTAGYSWYATSLAGYDLLYGALSSVIALMIWFFFIAWVLFLGMLCNKVWGDSNDYHSGTSVPEYMRQEPPSQNEEEEE